MEQYKDLLQRVVSEGIWKENRTGIPTKSVIGGYCTYDLYKEGFPVVTLRKIAWRAAIAEMLCFLRGYTNAADFRRMGCNVWDKNANKTESWLNNTYRKGKDDLGKIYGYQWRNFGGVDQLTKVYEDLKAGVDNRREIITAWNPVELNEMALPPCHMTMQFFIHGEELHLKMYQRSADLPLGVPFNIIGYSWLLLVMVKITNLKPGIFHHFMGDIHIYENQMFAVNKMLSRTPFYQQAYLEINPDIKNLEDLLTWVTVEDFKLHNYYHHEGIKMDMAE